MSNKRWEHNGDKHILYFTPFYEEEKIAEIFYDEFDGAWYMGEGIWPYCAQPLFAYTLEDAKENAENNIAKYYTDQRNYYQELYDKFVEETL